jgi:hypothetical protein
MRTTQSNGAVLAPPHQVSHLSKFAKAFGLTASADGTRIASIIEADEADVYVGDLEGSGFTPRQFAAAHVEFENRLSTCLDTG